MIIPNKYSGYQAGIRLYPGGGGGGGQPAAPTIASPPPPPPQPWETTGFGATGGVNTQEGYNILQSAKGQPWEQSGGQYNDLLTRGFTSDQIRQSAGQMYGAPSNENFNQMVTHAGMTSPTGRPLAGSAQFYQPIQQQQYQNYANPYTAFNVSTYGTQPMVSQAQQWQAANGGNPQNVYNSANNWLQQNAGADMNTMMSAMRGVGMNPYDVQAAGGYSNYAPSFGMPQMQTPFNPYTNSFGYGVPQMQTPFSYGGTGGYGGGVGIGNFMPNQSQSSQPMQPTPQRVSSGPAQAIVSRSAGLRGTPNVMRRAEGGITSLMDAE